MTKKLVWIILVVIGLGLAGFGVWEFILSRRPSAGLKVQTDPPSLVFVNNNQVGQTPLDKVFQPGTINLKVVPSSSGSALPTYETQVQLHPDTYTVVHRDFGPTNNETAGDVITLEKSGQDASLSVVSSNPETASVTLDGEPQGFTPVWVPQLVATDHQIVVSAPGYESRTITIKTVTGHKLSINAKLAQQVMPSPTPTPVTATASATLKPFVEIKSTPTGFLRVRNKPSGSGTEVGQIKPGAQYHVLDQQDGWYEIQVDLDATSSGWISAQYATETK